MIQNSKLGGFLYQCLDQGIQHGSDFCKKSHNFALYNINHKMFLATRKFRVTHSLHYMVYTECYQLIMVVGSLFNIQYSMLVFHSTFHRLCSTYPKTLMVPQYFQDDQLKKVAKFRKLGRVPAVVWRYVD